MQPLVIWSNAKLDDAARAALTEGTRAHRLVVASGGPVAPAGSGAADPALGEADVAFGQPAPAQLLVTPRLRFIQLNSAGYGPYDRDDLRLALAARGARLTKSSLVYAGSTPPSRTPSARAPGRSRRFARGRGGSKGSRSCSSASARSRAASSSSSRRSA
jgi:hypothetical protein